MPINSRNKRVLQSVLCFGALLLALNLGWQWTRAHRAFNVRAATTTRTPYTVVRTECGFDKTGTLRYTNHYVEALKTDGSTLWQATTSLVQQRTIHNANGDKVMTNDRLEKKSTYPGRYSAFPSPRDPSASCQTAADIKLGATIAGTDTVGGFRTVRQVLVQGRQTTTRWYAPDADCALVQLRYEHEDGVTLQDLTSLVLAEPDPALFQVSAGFEEVPPSGLFVPICSGGGSCNALPDSVKQRLDKKYFDVRAAN